MTPDRIEREITIAAPPERVWSVITEAEHLGTWFADAGAEVDLRPGGAMLLTWHGYGTPRARIEAVEPPRRFAFRWTARNSAPGAEPAEGNATHVEFTLTPAGEGTRLRVVETGFAALATSAEEQRACYDDHVEGWGIELGHLTDHVARVAA